MARTWLFAGGAFVGVLMVAAIALTLLQREQSFEAGTPERAVQDFLKAYDSEEFGRVYDMWSEELRQDCGRDDYVQQAVGSGGRLSDSRVRITDTEYVGNDRQLAVVLARETHVFRRRAVQYLGVVQPVALRPGVGAGAVEVHRGAPALLGVSCQAWKSHGCAARSRLVPTAGGLDRDGDAAPDSGRSPVAGRCDRRGRLRGDEAGAPQARAVRSRSGHGHHAAALPVRRLPGRARHRRARPRLRRHVRPREHIHRGPGRRLHGRTGGRTLDDRRWSAALVASLEADRGARIAPAGRDALRRPQAVRLRRAGDRGRLRVRGAPSPRSSSSSGSRSSTAVPGRR